MKLKVLVLAVLVLLAAASVSALSTVYVYVDPDATGTGTGADWTNAFTSLQAAETAKQKDIVASDEIYWFKCRSSGGTADTKARFVGWGTPDATRYIVIESVDDNGGVYNPSKYRIEGDVDATSGALLSIEEGFTRVINVQIGADVASTTGTRYGLAIGAAGAGSRISKCIIQMTDSTTNGGRYGLYSGGQVAATPALVWNCIIYDCYTGAYYGGSGETASTIFYNCTAVDSGIGFKTDTNDSNAYMCLASDCTDCYNGTFNAGDHNASTGSDAPGTNAHNVTRGTEFAFANYAGDDFHLNASFDGTTDPSSGLYADDIDGDERSGTFDIGADEMTGTPTYTVTYNGNGNTGGTAPVDASSPYEESATVTVLDEGTLVKAAGAFSHWNTAANDSGTDYDPEDTFEMPAANVTLYAQWIMTYYVSTSGTSGGTGAIDDPWTMAKANATLVAGDTVRIRGGTYSGITGSAVDPANTGSSGKVITYVAYTDETPVFTGSGGASIAIDLDSTTGTERDYIKVDGLTFTGFYKRLWILKGDYNEIVNCTFTGNYGTVDGNYRSSVIYSAATYNHVHNCTFGEHGEWDGETASAQGDLFALGNADVVGADDVSYNLVEDCVFYHAAHAVFDLEGHNNVVRNNYFHNEGWLEWTDENLYSDRIIFSAGNVDKTYRNLFEGNIMGWAEDTPPVNATVGGSGGTWATTLNIVRRNVWHNTKTHAIRVSYYSGAGLGTNQYFYNNTVWHCGFNSIDKDNYNTYQSHAVSVVSETEDTHVFGNVFKNNLFWDNANTVYADRSIINSAGAVPVWQDIGDNWMEDADGYGDPLFVDIVSALSYTSSALPNVHLLYGSPCIDTAGWLTTITSETGSGTSFVVADAGYFMDGWGISGVAGDEIQLEGAVASVTITGVDYDTDTITVDENVSWTQGDGVALAFSGTAPDYGAYEYASGTTYTLTYDGNEETGGSAPTDASSPYEFGQSVTVIGNTGSLEKTGYSFNGWNTTADGTGTSRSPGAVFLMPALNTTLYAQWEKISGSLPSKGTTHATVQRLMGLLRAVNLVVGEYMEECVLIALCIVLAVYGIRRSRRDD